VARADLLRRKGGAGELESDRVGLVGDQQWVRPGAATTGSPTAGSPRGLARRVPHASGCGCYRPAADLQPALTPAGAGPASYACIAEVGPAALSKRPPPRSRSTTRPLLAPPCREEPGTSATGQPTTRAARGKRPVSSEGDSRAMTRGTARLDPASMPMAGLASHDCHRCVDFAPWPRA